MTVMMVVENFVLCPAPSTSLSRQEADLPAPLFHMCPIDRVAIAKWSCGKVSRLYFLQEVPGNAASDRQNEKAAFQREEDKREPPKARCPRTAPSSSGQRWLQHLRSIVHLGFLPERKEMVQSPGSCDTLSSLPLTSICLQGPLSRR